MESAAWMGRAACALLPKADLTWFFEPDHDELPEGDVGGSKKRAVTQRRFTKARRVCASCPVRAPCADYGLREAYGVWGNTSPTQREQERRKNNIALRGDVPAGNIYGLLESTIPEGLMSTTAESPVVTTTIGRIRIESGETTVTLRVPRDASTENLQEVFRTVLPPGTEVPREGMFFDARTGDDVYVIPRDW